MVLHSMEKANRKEKRCTERNWNIFALFFITLLMFGMDLCTIFVYLTLPQTVLSPPLSCFPLLIFGYMWFSFRSKTIKTCEGCQQSRYRDGWSRTTNCSTLQQSHPTYGHSRSCSQLPEPKHSLAFKSDAIDKLISDTRDCTHYFVKNTHMLTVDLCCFIYRAVIFLFLCTCTFEIVKRARTVEFYVFLQVINSLESMVVACLDAPN